MILELPVDLDQFEIAAHGFEASDSPVAIEPPPGGGWTLVAINALDSYVIAVFKRRKETQ